MTEYGKFIKLKIKIFKIRNIFQKQKNKFLRKIKNLQLPLINLNIILQKF